VTDEAPRVDLKPHGGRRQALAGHPKPHVGRSITLNDRPSTSSRSQRHPEQMTLNLLSVAASPEQVDPKPHVGRSVTPTTDPKPHVAHDAILRRRRPRVGSSADGPFQSLPTVPSLTDGRAQPTHSSLAVSTAPDKEDRQARVAAATPLEGTPDPLAVTDERSPVDFLWSDAGFSPPRGRATAPRTPLLPLRPPHDEPASPTPARSIGAKTCSLRARRALASP
jgi:hypothetical protein